MTPEQIKNRIIESADDYHRIGEEHWVRATELEPASEEAAFEFRRLLGVAMSFYIRSFLILGMVETDDDQELTDLLDIAADELPELAELIQQNDAFDVLNEDAEEPLSRIFSVAEVLRTVLLQQSNQRAATF